MSFVTTNEIDTYKVGNNVKCLCLVSSPGGIFIGCISLIQSLSNTIQYEISIWTQSGGLKKIGKVIYECNNNDITNEFCSILWNPIMERLCVVIYGNLLMINLKWEDKIINKHISATQAAFINKEDDEVFTGIDKLNTLLTITRIYSINATNAITC